jgi:hypothetical protein
MVKARLEGPLTPQRVILVYEHDDPALDRRKVLQASSPSMTGIMISSIVRSGLQSLVFCTVSFPFEARSIS